MSFMDIKFLDKNKSTYNIVIFGDSISRGVIYDEVAKKYIISKQNYTSILQEYLKAGVDNTARFGNTILRGLQKVIKIVDKKNHDIALIEFGGNDCDFNWEEVANNPSLDHQPKTDFHQFEEQLLSLVTYINKKDMFPVLFSLPPLECERYFNWITQNDLLKKKNILEFLGAVSRIYWWQERYNSTILTIAAKTNTPIIDIRSAFLRQDDYRDFICLDGIHPNINGHKLMATTIYDFIQHKYSFLLESDKIFST